MLMNLGTVSSNSKAIPNVQANLRVTLVQFCVKCSCATYVVGARIFLGFLSYSVYKPTPTLTSNTTLRLSVCYGEDVALYSLFCFGYFMLCFNR